MVAGFVPAPHVPLPRVAAHSGTVVSAVQLVTITYADDAQRAQLESFADAMLASPWYAQVGAEYGVQGGRSLAPVHLDHSPPSLSRADVARDLAARADAGQLPPPVADVTRQVIYVLYVPSTVNRAPDLVASYHATITVNGLAVPFAVVIEDPTDVTATTVAAARVVLNAASDPYPVPLDGFYADPPSTDPWTLVPAEIADLCAGDPPVAVDTTHPQFLVPRVYSNHAAAGGGPPCTPTASGDLWNDVSADPPQLQPVAPGGSATFEIVGWSTQQMPDWRLTIQAAERSALSTAELAPVLDRDTINNDQQVTLTLHVPLDARLGEIGGVTLVSTPSGHLWTVGVVVSDDATRAR